MPKRFKFYFTFALAILMIIAFKPTCYSNSAEPPSILIIAPNPPMDLEIMMKADNTYIKARTDDKLIEKYFAFYSRDIDKVNTIEVKTENESFEIILNEPAQRYNNIYTLDMKNKALIPGKLPSRSIILVSLRVTLTLLIEALVFWLFGYRRKQSWIAFLIINLVTQGALNIWLGGSSPMASYIILSLIIGEFFVFIAEIIAFLAALREHGPIRAILYVIAANLVSLFAGGYIITILPV